MVFKLLQKQDNPSFFHNVYAIENNIVLILCMKKEKAFTPVFKRHYSSSMNMMSSLNHYVYTLDITGILKSNMQIKRIFTQPVAKKGPSFADFQRSKRIFMQPIPI